MTHKLTVMSSSQHLQQILDQVDVHLAFIHQRQRLQHERIGHVTERFAVKVPVTVRI